MTNKKQMTLSQVVKPLFKKHLSLNDICTNVMTASINGTLSEVIPFDKVSSEVKREGSTLGYILTDSQLHTKVEKFLSNVKILPSAYSDTVKLAEKFSLTVYKDTLKVLDVFKECWTGTFPVNYKLDSDWDDTIENQVLYEIFKSDESVTVENLMQNCRTNLHTKETESSPSHALTEKRADQYTKKVLKWFKLFQKISEKHEVKNML